jgi:hypothetical protein
LLHIIRVDLLKERFREGAINRLLRRGIVLGPNGEREAQMKLTAGTQKSRIFAAHIGGSGFSDLEHVAVK